MEIVGIEDMYQDMYSNIEKKLVTYCSLETIIYKTITQFTLEL